MGRQRIIPGADTLRHWIEDEKLTHQEIADRIFEETGERVGRSAVSVAAHRAGISTTGPRYKDHIPWRVNMMHIRSYPLRMLRLMGRADQGGELNDVETKALANWLDMLEREQMIVAYDMEDPQGLHYIDAEYKDHDGLAPVRKKMIHLNRT